MSIADYSTVPGDNVEISGIDIAEGCPVGGMNDAIRQLMADIKTEHDTIAADYATMDECDAKFATLSALNGKLSKTGDTITGATLFNGVANFGTGRIKKNSDDAFLAIDGANATANGARLLLYGKDCTDSDGKYKGAFRLQARDGTGTVNELTGYSAISTDTSHAGSLYWNGYKVVTRNDHATNSVYGAVRGDGQTINITDGVVSVANGSTTDSTKLPLAGGTMTGAVKLSAGTDANTVLSTGTNDQVALCGGNETSSNSVLHVYGKNKTGNKNNIVMTVRNETGTLAHNFTWSYSGVSCLGKSITWDADGINIDSDAAGITVHDADSSVKPGGITVRTGDGDLELFGGNGSSLVLYGDESGHEGEFVLNFAGGAAHIAGYPDGTLKYNGNTVADSVSVATAVTGGLSGFWNGNVHWSYNGGTLPHGGQWIVFSFGAQSLDIRGFVQVLTGGSPLPVITEGYPVYYLGIRLPG